MKRLVAGLVVLALPLLGCVSTSDYRRLENQVHAISGGDIGEHTRKELADLAAQLDELTKEVDELRGSLEVADHRADQALREARQARAEANAGPGARPPTTGGAAPAPLPAAVPPGGPEIDSSPGALSMSSEEVASYRRAYGSWRRGELQACVEGFREFLQTYRSSPYADDALYWMADCYYRQGDNEKAILRFAKVVELYPDGNKAPDALFRQGEVLLKLGPSYSNAARDVFQRVLAEYPDSPRADEAQRQLERLRAG